MNIIAVDDERLSLSLLESTILSAAPAARLRCFSSPFEALEYATGNPIDIAFLDIDMSELSGLLLAQRLKEIHPRLNIIFVTGYSEFGTNAFTLRASGYLLKPVRPSAVENELKFLRYPLEDDAPPVRVRVKCFGGFDLFVDGERLPFSRSKPKELLAYLVHQTGAGVTIAQIAAVLWEDRAYTRRTQNYVQTVISRMLKILREAGIDDIILRSWNSISIDPKKITCDYYEFLNGDIAARNSFAGDYMGGYSWAQTTEALLTQMRLK